MKSFTIVSQPNYEDGNNDNDKQWRELFPPQKTNSFRVKLLESPNRLGNAVNAFRGVELIHPNSNNVSTFGIWQDPDQYNNYFVKDPGDVGQLDKPEDYNLLYMPTLRGYKSVQFKDTLNNRDYSYKVVPLKKLKFPSSIASEESDAAGVFFEQVPNNEIDTPDIILYISDNKNCQGQPIGWLNPAILNFTLDGKDIKDIDVQTQDIAQQVLRLFLSDSALLLVEPHIDDRHDLRISFLKKLKQRIDQRTGGQVTQDLSLFEYVLLGGKTSNPWKPFLSLDLLGGEFYVQKHGDQDKPVIHWKPPSELPSNAGWFADYCLKQWVGTQLDHHIAPNIVEPPPSPRPYGSIKGLDSFTVGDLDRVNSSCSLLLSHHPQFREGNLYHFLVKLLQDFQGREEEKCHYGSVRSDRTQSKVSFDDVYFMNRFSKCYVAPKSPVLVAIPGVDKFLDPIRSVNNGDRDFLLRLFNSLDLRRAPEGTLRDRPKVKLPNRFGWWNDWHSILFKDRWDIEVQYIDFLPGFVLGRSRLGKGLGKGYLGLNIVESKDWKSEIMHF